ncbi:hypothetical protein BPAE_0023g00610 [Botrytis paeoniae]|uniref:Uncharacterized protein n=1 Tax=Botrytis paeoniae TaxID=278948 RepID=A0A4Z1G4B2_9HELO|nr:hypothetical protein BPAE_0023g00610 [Botrytis paeoniae]
MLPGENLRTKWRKLSENSIQNLVKQIAQYRIQLSRHKFPAIGNIFVVPEPQPVVRSISASVKGTPQDSQQLLPALWEIVSMFFFWRDHITQDRPRSPFTNSKTWLYTHLTLLLTDQEKILTTTDDEDEIEDVQDANIHAEELLKLVPSIFPTTDFISEQCVLFHDDLSLRDILVDNDGTITRIVDWECVPILPLWKACVFPIIGDYFKWDHRIQLFYLVLFNLA